MKHTAGIRGSVLLLALGLLGSCTEDPKNASHTESISIKVTPDKGFRLKLPNGTSIIGPPGAAKKPGTLIVTSASRSAPNGSPLTLRRFSGFTLVPPGGELAKPVTISFPAPRASRVENALPVIVHVDDRNRWFYDEAKVKGDRFEVTTADFSFRAPGWLNPLSWLRELFHGALHLVNGRTDPPRCSTASIAWASLEKMTTLLHTCLKSTPDPKATIRAEEYLKGNRNFYLKVAYDGNADYTWQQNPDSLFARAARRVLRYDEQMLLPPGEEMSVGYRQPSLDADMTTTAYLDIPTALLTTVSPIIDELIPDGRGGFAALWALKTCVSEFPASLDDVGGYWDFIRCTFIDALPQLKDEKKATAAARSLLGDGARLYGVDAPKELENTASKTKLLGQAVEAVGLLSVIRDEILQMTDSFSQWGSDRPGDVALHLRAGPLSTAQLQNEAIPAGTCGNVARGWNQPLPIQLHDGKGQYGHQDSPGGAAVIYETDVLGWADFDGDGQRDVALMVECSGTEPQFCCASQSSQMNFVGVFSVPADDRLRLIAPVLEGSAVGPGDEYGPAQSAIASAVFDGTSFTTGEYVLYAQNYTAGQLGGIDPDNPTFTTTWHLDHGRWTSSHQPVTH